VQSPQVAEALPEFPERTTAIAPNRAIATPTASPVAPLSATAPPAFVASKVTAPESPELAVEAAIPLTASAMDNALPVLPDAVTRSAGTMGLFEFAEVVDGKLAQVGALELPR
jgi:hypothetical protein